MLLDRKRDPMAVWTESGKPSEKGYCAPCVSQAPTAMAAKRIVLSSLLDLIGSVFEPENVAATPLHVTLAVWQCR